MPGPQNFSLDTRGSLCDACGIPLDAEHFDVHGFRALDGVPGRAIVLAEFQLEPQYCGVLQYFSQFTERWSQTQNPTTAGLTWSLRANGHPLYPYDAFTSILNPWGYGSYPITVRLDEATTVQITVQVTDTALAIQQGRAGGRLMGRFWYNTAYGGRTLGR